MLSFKITPFQSTYLYKVRRGGGIGSAYIRARFNPRTYIRYDFRVRASIVDGKRFNPRTYIRYDAAS